MDDATKVVVEKVVNLLFSLFKREIDYVRKCIENVDNLQNEVNKLKKLKGDVQQKIDIAKSKGEKLSYGVQEWVEKNDRIAKAEAFLQETFLQEWLLTQEVDANQSCNCQNFGTLHQYGKRATKITRSLVQHYEAGKPFESCCSVPTSLPEFLDLFDRKNYDDVDTQKQKLEEIIEAIKDEKIQIIEINGTGGTGKTTLAKEAAVRVQNQFDDIVFIIVSQNIESESNRNKIEVAARRIKNKEKVLLILDDVWEQLKMNNLGILYGKNYMNCKILLTSRLEEACSAKKMKKKIPIYPLPQKEAWIFFKREVGEVVENNPRLEELAMEVAKECSGLPLILEVIGNTLKEKDEDIWKAALDQLKNHVSYHINPEIRNAFDRLKLSYDYLQNDRSNEARSCFLLCSMFPEDTSISLERLALYCVGLGKFAAFNCIEEARNRVRIAVNTLKSSSLLMNGSSRFSAKMHDIARSVAILIASENKGNNKFFVKAGKGMTKWRPKDPDLESFTGISLMQNSISMLPKYKLHVPLLEILLAQDNTKLSEISNEFIQSLVKVKVLDMEHNDISSLPSSMKLLMELRMLNLGGNKSLQEIAILGDLKDLEILILNDTSIQQIPEEIGQLENLRLLQVRGCHTLSHIAPGVISKLTSLEELNIGFYVEQVNNYNSLVELSDLSSLTNLDLFVHAFSLIPEGVEFETLKRFVIQIGGNETSFNIPREFDSGHHLILEIPDLPHSMAPKKLIEASDFIYLKSVKTVSNILPDLPLKSFNEVKSVELIQCENVSCLVDTKNLGGPERNENLFLKMQKVILRDMRRLEVLWKCPNQYIGFSNLEEIFIGLCPGLARVFPVNVAQGLVCLKSIVLSDCKSLEVVIWDGDHEETSNSATEISEHGAMNIEFPRLTTINLDRLPKLNRFYSGNSSIKYPSLRILSVFGCSSLKTWGSGLHEMPKINFQYQGERYNIGDIMTICSEKNEPVPFDNQVTNGL